MRTDGWSDRRNGEGVDTTNLKVAFHNFANASTKVLFVRIIHYLFCIGRKTLVLKF